MKIIILPYFIFLALTAQAQNCPPNIDFEAGNFSNWQCFVGGTYTSGGQNVIDLSPSSPVSGRHEVITPTSTPALDPYGNFPRHCPYSGSNFSIKLGNDNTDSEAEGLSYTFQIPPLADTFSLTYFYAVVFENPGHPTSDQPRFFVTAYDVVTGDLINCASYNYVSTASIPGFQHNADDTSILYKDWTPASIDFSGLAGRMVRLEFKTADCTQGAHFGYAYVDVSTGCGGLITVAALCGSSNTVALNAPFGFQTYTWYNANYSVIIGQQQNVTLNPAPPANSMFHVDMIPYPGFGCRDTADAQVTALPVPDTPSGPPLFNYCQYDNAQTLTAVPTSPNSLLWYSTATGGIGSQTPPQPSTASPGIFQFYVSQKALFGCESDRREITVRVLATPGTDFTINNDRQCQGNNNFIFSSTTTDTNPDAVYTWDFGDGGTSALPVATHTYTDYGMHTVKLNVLNPPACNNEKVDQVFVVAAPIADFTYPVVICEQQTPVILGDNSSVPGNSGTISNWQWTIANGNVNVQNPPSFLANAGNLVLQLVVSTLEGCVSDPKNVTLPVHFRPVSKLAFRNAVCENEVISFTNQSAMPAGGAPDYISSWNWEVNGSFNNTSGGPFLNLPSGIHHVKLSTESNMGCRSLVADSVFTVYGKPDISLFISDSCVKRNLRYEAVNTGPNTVSNWLWDFGNGYQAGAQIIVKTFSHEQNAPVKLIGESIKGCRDTLLRPFAIYENHAFAGQDTIVAIGQAVQLNAGGTDMISYTWTPSLGLNASDIRNPIATLGVDQLYEIYSLSKYGCDARSTIFIKRYKGPELFIPGAFTPNDDGLNDVLKVFPVGIKTFHSFAVYNRLGVRLFYTTDYAKGWDGMYRGQKTDPGTYVVYAQALDYRGKTLSKRGSVVLLR